jgi:hypothetical protein
VLKDHIKTALDENRILMLGLQVLVGFQYRVFFEPGFERLPHPTRGVGLLGLWFLLIALGFLLSTTPRHQLLERGGDSRDLERFIQRVMEVALLPIALGLGVVVYLAVATLRGGLAPMVAGEVTALVALYFWYGLELYAQGRRPNEVANMTSDYEPRDTPLKDRIVQVLTEARMVLPGAQALLGFQFAIMFMSGFDNVPPASKLVHLASLFLIALSTILLMTPAAYHRLVERGYDTENFHQVASRLTLWAMVPLGIGISGDVFVVTERTTSERSLAVLSFAVALVFFFGLWFGWPLYKRMRRARQRACPW